MSLRALKPKRPGGTRFLKLLPYSKLREMVTAALRNATIGTEVVAPSDALGRVCAESVVSGHDVPAAPVSAMDGYAVRSAETKTASPTNPVRFNVKGSVFPGPGEVPRLGRLEAFYVATGAPIPKGADAVVRVEEARLSGDQIVVMRSIPKWKNVALRGEDIHSGQVIVERGRIIRPPDIALLISAGRSNVRVFRRPRVGILSVGDDLTEPGSIGGKTVNNYSNLICGYLSETGSDPLPMGVASDDPVQVRNIIEGRIDELDAIITIGGCSVGENDQTPSAFPEGLLFHGIRLLPIKPTGMAIVRRKPIILLPGHAVSAALSFFLVALPALNIISGLGFDTRIPGIKARAAKRFSNTHTIDALYLVRLRRSDGEYEATPLGWGSNSLSNLARANGFLRLAPAQVVEKGEAISVTLLGGLEMSRVMR
jgi:molybdopterin molybdotransferase